MTKHRWNDPVRPDLNNTFRSCKNCGLIKITRHEPDNRPRDWVQFKHGEKQVVFKNDPSKTPPCVDYTPLLTTVPA